MKRQVKISSWPALLSWLVFLIVLSQIGRVKGAEPFPLGVEEIAEAEFKACHSEQCIANNKARVEAILLEVIQNRSYRLILQVYKEPTSEYDLVLGERL